MKKYYCENELVACGDGWSGSDMDVYLASEVEARVAELAAKWEAEIAVAFNEYSHGQRAGLEQAAFELRKALRL